MEVRRLRSGDAAAVWQLRLTALQSEPAAFGESVEEHLQTSVEVLAGRLDSGGEDNFVLGAISDSVLVGMVGFYRELRPKRRHRGWIWGMYVRPEWRGQAIAARLLGEAIRCAREIPGVRRVLLSVSCTQPAARRLYEKLGFTVFAAEPEALLVDGQYIDVELMGLTLHGP